MQLQNATQTAYIRFVIEEIEYNYSQGLGFSLEMANNQTNKTLPNIWIEAWQLADFSQKLSAFLQIPTPKIEFISEDFELMLRSDENSNIIIYVSDKQSFTTEFQVSNEDINVFSKEVKKYLKLIAP
jgi:hypothetical protein